MTNSNEPISIRIIGINNEHSRNATINVLSGMSSMTKDECISVVDNALNGTVQTIEIPLKTRIQQEKEAIETLNDIGFIIG